MSINPDMTDTDRECLEEAARRPAVEALRPVIDFRYLAFVYSSALRRTTGEAIETPPKTQ